ncbi:MAG: hypothetical protein HON94_08330 [Methylococcales bacterium]|jgi:hypothetical protein|nr:hypothetical protein [Methylococcales bacterium]MBT7411329.1 hypothetical protein [Methylococcales bacterium]
MKTVKEIQLEIEMLPRKEYMKLVHWFSERDWEAWDSEIEEDIQSGKLDFLIDEAVREKKNEKLKSL